LFLYNLIKPPFIPLKVTEVTVVEAVQLDLALVDLTMKPDPAVDVEAIEVAAAPGGETGPKVEVI